MLNKVAETIAKIAPCNIEDVKPETKLVDLGIDSLKAVSVLFELEEVFDIEIPNEIIPTIVTVNDILKNLDNLSR